MASVAGCHWPRWSHEMQARIIRWGVGSLLSRKYDRYVNWINTYLTRQFRFKKRILIGKQKKKHTHTTVTTKNSQGLFPCVAQAARIIPLVLGMLCCLAAGSALTHLMAGNAVDPRQACEHDSFAGVDGFLAALFFWGETGKGSVFFLPNDTDVEMPFLPLKEHEIPCILLIDVLDLKVIFDFILNSLICLWNPEMTSESETMDPHQSKLHLWQPDTRTPCWNLRHCHASLRGVDVGTSSFQLWIYRL